MGVWHHILYQVVDSGRLDTGQPYSPSSNLLWIYLSAGKLGKTFLLDASSSCTSLSQRWMAGVLLAAASHPLSPTLVALSWCLIYLSPHIPPMISGSRHMPFWFAPQSFIFCLPSLLHVSFAENCAYRGFLTYGVAGCLTACPDAVPFPEVQRQGPVITSLSARGCRMITSFHPCSTVLPKERGTRN